MDYITAGNDVVDNRKRFTRSKQLTADQLSSLLLDRALERRSLMRKRLSLHQELHRLSIHNTRG